MRLYNKVVVLGGLAGGEFVGRRNWMINLYVERGDFFRPADLSGRPGVLMHPCCNGQLNPMRVIQDP